MSTSSAPLDAATITALQVSLPGIWPCNVCSYDNEGKRKRCVMCNSPRVLKATQPRDQCSYTASAPTTASFANSTQEELPAEPGAVAASTSSPREILELTSTAEISGASSLSLLASKGLSLEWPCDLCSFLNPASDTKLLDQLRCAMCDTPGSGGGEFGDDGDASPEPATGHNRKKSKHKAHKKEKSFKTNLPWLRRSVRHEGGAEECMPAAMWEHCLEDIAAELGGWAEVDGSTWIRSGNGISGGGRCMYGRAKPMLVEDVAAWCHLGQRDLFVDVGSGMGQVVFQVATTVGCRAVGVEVLAARHSAALQLLEYVEACLEDRGFRSIAGTCELLHCSLLDPALQRKYLEAADVLMVNNAEGIFEADTAGKDLNGEVAKVARRMRIGARVASLDSLVGLNGLVAAGAFTVRRHSSGGGATGAASCSWREQSGKAQAVWVYTKVAAAWRCDRCGWADNAVATADACTRGRRVGDGLGNGGGGGDEADGGDDGGGSDGDARYHCTKKLVSTRRAAPQPAAASSSSGAPSRPPLKGKRQRVANAKDPSRAGPGWAWVSEDEDDGEWHVEACVACGKGGELLCCDECPAAYHLTRKCCGQARESLPLADAGLWFCPACREAGVPARRAEADAAAARPSSAVDADPSRYRGSIPPLRAEKGATATAGVSKAHV